LRTIREEVRFLAWFQGSAMIDGYLCRTATFVGETSP
jgi:hypothetical protein